jgi:hypothetical protein
MANWRTGFFRLWVLLSVLWVVAIGALSFNGIVTPWVSETLFTFNKLDELEVVTPYSEEHTKLLANETSGYYTRVGFKDEAPRMIYMAPNAFEVLIRGKKFEALLSNERVNNPDHDALTTALVDFIATNDLDLDPPIRADEVRSAIPSPLKLQYREPWVKFAVRDFAVETQRRLTEDARGRALIATAAGMLMPPGVILALGTALGWVLSGFRRKQQAAT